MIFNVLFAVFSFLFVLSRPATALPLKRAELLAVAPAVTSPSADSVWFAGSTGTVSWDTTQIPPEAQHYVVTILLGHLEDNSSNENLDIQHPLATQVPIMSGTTEVTVPVSATCQDHCVVAVIGDSGDISPRFSIVKLGS